MNWITGLFSWVMSLFGVPNADTEEVVKIQATAVRLCGFLPTVDTVLALMAANPLVATGTVIARKICTAVTARKPSMMLAGMAGGSPPIIVDGVVIEGEFVNPKEK